MTDIYRNVYDLLNGAVSCKVFTDVVPENEAVPAISFVNIGFHNDRVISGDKSSGFTTWRITLLAVKLSDITKYIAELETLDNKQSTKFSRVFIDHTVTEQKLEEDLYRRAFVDLRVY